MSQTLAIFLDAYRELNARKMFWITMVISGVVVLAFAFIGINEQGLRIIVWDIPFPLNTTQMSPAVFYKSLFVSLGIGVWLSWAATILALISTASVIPDLISSGSVDLMLSKPISRLRLFLTKYTTGLMFVTLQVSVFSVASFLVLGFKGNTWEPALFLAVPLVVIFYSYLFSICALFGLITRSTIASLLLTLLAWLLIFALHTADVTMLSFQLMLKQRAETVEKWIDSDQARLEQMQLADDPNESEVRAAQRHLDDRTRELESTRSTLATLDTVHSIVLAVKTCLPKTSETIDLLERWLIDMAELPSADDSKSQQSSEFPASFEPNDERLQQAAVEAFRERSVFWILGTSLLFEAAVLALASWLFCRRDF